MPATSIQILIQFVLLYLNTWNMNSISTPSAENLMDYLAVLNKIAKSMQITFERTLKLLRIYYYYIEHTVWLISYEPM